MRPLELGFETRTLESSLEEEPVQMAVLIGFFKTPQFSSEGNVASPTGFEPVSPP